MPGMHSYRIFDQLVGCDQALRFAPAQVTSHHAPGDILNIVRAPVAEGEGECIHDVEDHPGGERLIVHRRAPGQGTITYAGWRFSFDLLVAHIRYQPAARGSWSLDTLLERVVLPIALLTTTRPLIALHGSAVHFPQEQAIAIIGDSGAGKSTTALALWRQGASLLADDLVLIDVERQVILAGAPALRLALADDAIPEASASFPTPTPDHKRIFSLPAASSTGRAIRLHQIVALSSEAIADSDYRLYTPRGAQVAALGLAQCFGFSRPEHSEDRARFRRAMRLLRKTPMTEIAFRRSSHTLCQIAAIEHLLAKPDSEGKGQP
ncbi:hypothetical protein DL240_02220 [Lujinxingia litoralis]|uniref:HPr kinase/phosphorylase C-terminal domain-containing protein n=1 Tax=Lujinxingia litoralis TaxID=2211119 RepID=A0A328CBT6_9DELT|nr:hypothetical protein [Lujinxingia litoralis]RAL25050.1 hypothetical protein DL240_02220 [Lujinxingia litoralis]